MALTKCPECERIVSSTAPTCPGCGAPVAAVEFTAPVQVKRKKARYTLGMILWYGLVITPAMEKARQTEAADAQATAARDAQASASREEDRKAAAAETEAKCQADEACSADRAIIAAGILCRDRIERLARYSVRWTDGWLETKFSRYEWLDFNKKIIAVYGDKAEFQNGFGAFQRAIYRCDLSMKKVIGEVLAVSLPSREPQVLIPTILPPVQDPMASNEPPVRRELPAWCPQARTNVEKMICADEDLSNADIEHGKKYFAAEAVAVDMSAFHKSTEEWRRSVRDNCRTKACLIDAYRAGDDMVSQGNAPAVSSPMISP
jgi:ribosomal protein L12E/L44/L45/RPP1/RPP2